MLRILVFGSYPDSLINFRLPLIVALIEKGFDVHVAAPGFNSNKEIASRLFELGCTVHDVQLDRAGLNPVKDILSFLGAARLMRKIRPDFFLGYTIKPVIYGLLACWFGGVKNRFALITGLGYAFTGEAKGKRGFVRSLIMGLYRLSLSRSSLVFFQNPDDELLFRNLGLLDDAVSSCVVNGSGVDVSHFPLSPLPVDVSFVLIARLLGDKGVREYARAAAAVKKLYPDVDFKLVGWIDENPDAISQSELDEWIETGGVNYLGKLDDVRPEIAKSSVYVLPSYREGTPRTVLEAMAMGRPVITTDAPGCRETVLDGKNGYLVPIKDVESLVAAMCNFINDPDLVASMGLESRKLAEAKYDVDKVNAFMLGRMGIR